MTESEFLKALKKELKRVDDTEREKILDYYAEQIEDRIENGSAEEAAVMEMGDVEQIAQTILADEKVPKKNKMSPLSLTLIIAGSPFWLPVVIALLCVLLAVAISLCAVIIAVFCCALAGIAGGVMGLVFSVGMLAKNTYAALFILGCGLVLAGTGLILMPLVIRGTSFIFRSIVSVISKNKGQEKPAKKLSWVYYAVCIAVMLAGCIPAIIAVSNIHGDFSRLSTVEKPTMQTQVVNAEECLYIKTDMDTQDIKINLSADDDIHFTYYTSDDISVSFNHEGDVVTITEKDRPWWSFGINFIPQQMQTLTVSVPEDYTGEYELETDTGDIFVNDISAGTITIKSDTGHISLSKINADKLESKCDTGTTTLSDVNIINDISLKEDTGDIHIKNVKTGNIEAELDTGNMTADRLLAESADFKTDTGDIYLKNAEVMSIKAELDTGSIITDCLLAESINIKTDTGDVKGTLAGKAEDYTVHAQTDTGSNNLAHIYTNGSRTLIVNCDTGDIKIDFAG